MSAGLSSDASYKLWQKLHQIDNPVEHCKKGENTGSPDPRRDGFLAGYMGIGQCVIFIPT